MKLEDVVAATPADRWSRAVLDSIPQGVWVVDTKGGTCFANGRMAEMLRCEPEELMHRSAFDFLFPEDASAANSAFHQRKQSEAPRQVEFRYRRADGTTLWTQVQSTPIHDDSGNLSHVVGMFTDITEQKHAEDVLKRNSHIISRLIDSNIVGIFEADAERIYGANDRFLQMIQRDRASLIDGGVSRREFTPPEFWERDEQAVHELRTTGLCTPYEKAYLRPDGTRVPVYIAGATMPGDALRWACFAIDLTSLKRAEAEASAARDAAEHANRAKDRFIAILSHELRTPLNPVALLLTSLAKDSALPPALRADLEMMRRNVELELRLIDDLLDMTRVLNGKLSLHRRRCDLHAILYEAVALIESDIRERALQLSWDLAADHHQIDADPARISQVVWNLVKNATKFTPAGGTIRIESRCADGRVQVHVRDSGRGISAEALEQIFMPYTQADTPDHPRNGGLGLGLAISKTIVELHGGTIRAASDGKDKGACFTFELNHLPATV
jgi:PAS domain S-box-containing protein